MSSGKEIPRLTKVGNYVILNRVGSGAFSIVYKVEKIDTKEVFGLKVFPKTNLATEGDITRFQREIDATAVLQHDNVVALHDFFADDTNFYLVIDFCQNGELLNYIIKNQKLVEPTAAFIFQQIVGAIAYCHSFGVIHRDLKPENILFDKFPHVRVSDFGLCGYMDDDKMMSTFCGSPCYCTPECLCHQNYDGKKSDIWSLGVILFFMVTGDFPWNVRNMPVMLKQIVNCSYTIPKEVSPVCADLISKILVHNPEDRLSLDQILKHPWMKLAAKAKQAQTSPAKRPALPPLPPVQSKKLPEIVAMTRSGSITMDHGVVSPFDSTAPLPITNGNRIVLGSAGSRSASIGHITKPVTPSPTISPRNRGSTITKPRQSLSAKRQRSVEMFSRSKGIIP